MANSQRIKIKRIKEIGHVRQNSKIQHNQSNKSVRIGRQIATETMIETEMKKKRGIENKKINQRNVTANEEIMLFSKVYLQ